MKDTTREYLEARSEAMTAKDLANSRGFLSRFKNKLLDGVEGVMNFIDEPAPAPREVQKFGRMTGKPSVVSLGAELSSRPSHQQGGR